MKVNCKKIGFLLVCISLLMTSVLGNAVFAETEVVETPEDIEVVGTDEFGAPLRSFVLSNEVGFLHPDNNFSVPIDELVNFFAVYGEPESDTGTSSVVTSSDRLRVLVSDGDPEVKQGTINEYLERDNDLFPSDIVQPGTIENPRNPSFAGVLYKDGDSYFDNGRYIQWYSVTDDFKYYYYEVTVQYTENVPSEVTISAPVENSFTNEDELFVEGNVKDKNDGDKVDVFYTIEKVSDAQDDSDDGNDHSLDENIQLNAEPIIIDNCNDTNTVLDHPFESSINIYDLTDGEYNVIIWTKDKNQASSENVVIPFTVDRTPPEKPIITQDPDIDTPTNEGVTIEIEYPDDASQKKYKVGEDGDWKDYEGSFEVDENETIYAKAIDEAGNESEIAEHEVPNIDTTPPGPPIITTSEDSTVEEPITVTIEPGEDDESGVDRVEYHLLYNPDDSDDENDEQEDSDDSDDENDEQDDSDDSDDENDEQDDSDDSDDENDEQDDSDDSDDENDEQDDSDDSDDENDEQEDSDDSDDENDEQDDSDDSDDENDEQDDSDDSDDENDEQEDSDDSDDENDEQDDSDDSDDENDEQEDSDDSDDENDEQDDSDDSDDENDEQEDSDDSDDENDEPNWTEYKGEFEISRIGMTRIIARTIDNAGNISEEASKDVEIDEKPSPTPTPRPPSRITPTPTPTPTPDTVTRPSDTIPGSDSGSPVDLAVFLQTDKSIYKEGEVITFTIDYTNRSSNVAYGVNVEAEIPENTTLEDGADGEVDEDTITWEIGSLSGRSSGIIEYTVKVDTLDEAEIETTNTATVSFSNDSLNFDDESSTVSFLLYSDRFKDNFHEKYIYGYRDNTFRPGNNITRAEVASIMFNILDLEENILQIKDYPDLTDDHWAYMQIQAVTNENIFTGYEDGSFRPDANITRAEFATVLANHMGYKDIESLQSNFEDIDGHWAQNFIEEIYRAKLIEGYIENDVRLFKPDNEITRAESVTIINNMLFRGPLLGAEIPFDDVEESHWAHGHILESSIDHHYVRNDDETETIVYPDEEE
ncbi:S-layer homology domain-containing protein [Herbivorax sp. ANBcel31]|uniref:S-layer homology domain-containing protein n=1 Tax=Herbivorax sp. ANBcel31 TaxID=3069754 RepID=UPI0027B687B9|nr:S-layer homology domain-containing protein [Herbivorax sp. ANBcel31]MDQ2088009.1 S-layer homology domain-containing protein [Herbivorax sp. ANBcel31]